MYFSSVNVQIHITGFSDELRDMIGSSKCARNKANAFHERNKRKNEKEVKGKSSGHMIMLID